MGHLGGGGDQVSFSTFLVTFFCNFGPQMGHLGGGRPSHFFDVFGHFFGSWSQDGPKTLPKTPLGAPKTAKTMIFHDFRTDFPSFSDRFQSILCAEYSPRRNGSSGGYRKT